MPPTSSWCEVAGTSAVRVRRPLQGGHEVVQVGLPAVVMGTQLLGEPRYPSLRGIMAARSREIVTWSLADLEIDTTTVGWGAAATRMLDTTAPAGRDAAIVVTAPPADAAQTVLDFLSSRGLA